MNISCPFFKKKKKHFFLVLYSQVLELLSGATGALNTEEALGVRQNLDEREMPGTCDVDVLCMFLSPSLM